MYAPIVQKRNFWNRRNAFDTKSNEKVVMHIRILSTKMQLILLKLVKYITHKIECIQISSLEWHYIGTFSK